MFGGAQPSADPRGDFGALADGPNKGGRDQRDRMEGEEDGVEPIFRRGAVVFMDEFIFRDEDRREGGEEAIVDEGVAREGDEEDEAHAEEDAESVDRMADPLPFGEAPPDMEIALVKGDRQRLQSEGEKAQDPHIFSKMMPVMLSPGPKARPTIGVPVGAVLSERIACQM